MHNFVDVGGVQFKISADGHLATAEIGKIERRLNGSKKVMKSFGKKIHGIFQAIGKSIFGIGLGVAALGTAFSMWVKDSVSAASKFNEANNRMLTVFKSIKKEASATARGLTSYGFSLSEATKTLGSIGDVLTGLGMGSQAALGMSDSIARLSQDLVSFTNFSGGVSGASDIITKALLGERDSLTSLGIKLNEVDLKKMGYTENLSRQKKAEITLKAIMQQSKNAMGDYARTQDSFANQTRKLTQNMKDLSVHMGQKLLPTVSGFVRLLNKEFIKTKDISDQTDILIGLLKRRGDITEKLTSKIENLSGAERSNLEVQKDQINAEIFNNLDKLIEKYDKYFKIYKNGYRKIVEFKEGGGLKIEAYASTELRALEISIFKVEKYKNELKSYRNEIEQSSISGRDRRLVQIRKTQYEVEKTLLKLKKEESNITTKFDDSIRAIAMAYQQGYMSKDMLSVIPEFFTKKIEKMASNPNLFKNLPKIANKSGNDAGTQFSLGFLEKLNLKKATGTKLKTLLADVNAELKKNKTQYLEAKKVLDQNIELTQKQADAIKYHIELVNKKKNITDEITKRQSEAAAAYQKQMNRWSKQTQKAYEEAQKLKALQEDMVSSGKSDLYSETVGKLGLNIGNTVTAIGKLKDKLDAAKKAGMDFGQTMAAAGGDIVTAANEAIKMIIALKKAWQDTAGAMTEDSNGDLTEASGLDKFDHVLKKINESIPVIGELIKAFANDNGFKTLGDQLDEIEKKKQLGLATTQDELDVIERYIDKAKDLGLSESDILDLKIKQKNLEKEITDEAIKQRQEVERKQKAEQQATITLFEKLAKLQKGTASEREAIQTLINEYKNQEGLLLAYRLPSYMNTYQKIAAGGATKTDIDKYTELLKLQNQIQGLFKNGVLQDANAYETLINNAKKKNLLTQEDLGYFSHLVDLSNNLIDNQKKLNELQKPYITENARPLSLASANNMLNSMLARLDAAVKAKNKADAEAALKTKLDAIQAAQEQLSLERKHEDVLKAQGKDTKTSIKTQLDLISKLLQQYQGINDKEEYQKQVYDLLIKQAELKKDLESETADAMQKQLDIQTEMNRLKSTGLFDSQNIYQSRVLGNLMRSQDYNLTQQIDVLNNLNIGDLAGRRTINIYGGINTEVNEATGDTLDEAVNQHLINMLGGY